MAKATTPPPDSPTEAATPPIASASGAATSEPTPLTWAQLRQILTRPVSYHRIFATIAGGAGPGLFLSQGFYWTNIVDSTNPERDGWFYKTQSEWEAETGLTRSEQETARRQLKSRALLLEDRRGLPAKLWFRFNKEAILAAVWHAINGEIITPETEAKTENTDSPQTRMRKSRKQGGAKAANKSAPKAQPLIENKAESSAETTSTTSVVDESLLERLCRVGVHINVARKLAAEHPEESASQLDYLPYRSGMRDPAKTLVSAIKNGWSAPAEFVTHQANEVAAATNTARLKAEELKRQQHNEAAEARAIEIQNHNDQLDAWFKSQAVEEREDIMARAERRARAIQRTGELPPRMLAEERRAVCRSILSIPEPPQPGEEDEEN